MRLLAGHERDHALLLVVMPGGADAGQRAQRRLAAIRRDREPGLQHQPVIEADAHAGLILLQRLDPRRAMQAHAHGRQQAPQGVDKHVVFDDPAQLRLAEGVGIEGQRIATGRIPHLHAAIGLHSRGEYARPRTELTEQGGIVWRERIHAQVACLALPRRRGLGFDQCHLQAFARQHQRRGRADHAAAGDHRVEPAAPAHAATLRHSAGTSPR